MSRLSYTIELAITDGKLDEFSEMAKAFTAATQEEPGTLRYQWFVSKDGSRCLIQEGFESSEALMVHLGNAGPHLPGLLAIAPITRFQVSGDASDEVRAVIDPLGAEHFHELVGFAR
jgi:quinol monooxygenase YgiN